MEELTLQQLLNMFASETKVVIEDQFYLNKTLWKGTIGEYFDEPKRFQWWKEVLTASIDDNVLVVRISL